MLKGFKDFITGGNLIETAVALVMALAVVALVNALIADNRYKEHRGITSGTKTCAECLSEIPEDASRCAHRGQPQAAAPQAA